MFLTHFPGSISGFVHDKHARTKRVVELRSPSLSQLKGLQEAGYGVFFTPNGIGEVRNPDGTLLRWDGNVVSLNACFADFDSGSKASQMERIRSCPAEPSLIVESKRGYHAYWFLKDREVTPERLSLWKRVQTSIAEKMEGDKACSNPSRLMRLPGYYHLKGEPFMVEVVSVASRDYTLAEMEVFFPPAPRAVYVPVSREYARKLYLPPIECLYDGNRHPSLSRVAGQMYRGRKAEEFPAVREALKTWYSLSCVNVKKDWEEEVDGMCAWIEVRELGAHSQ